MHFASDNAGPAHPRVLEALTAANQGHVASYGADPLMTDVTARLRTIFEAPEAAVHLVATGTAANVLALATLSQPWQTIFCAPAAHIQQDECNAPEFYSGAKLTLVGNGAGAGGRHAAARAGDDAVSDTAGGTGPAPGGIAADKIDAAALRAAYAAEGARGVHGPQRGPLSLTQCTEHGRVYDLTEIAELSGIARAHGQPVHMDGARFANALVAGNATPAEMTWRAGIDALSFGGTKNGCLGVEAVILFDPALSWEFELRRKRGAHLFSKHRFLSAQMAAYLRDDLWRDTARRANAACARLAEGLRKIEGVRFLHEPQANMLFAYLPRDMHRRLRAAGAAYALWGSDPDELNRDGGPLLARLVCDWSLPDDSIDGFLALATG